MSQYIEFVTNHYLLFVALAGVIGLIAWTELRRFMVGYKEVAPAEAVRLMNHEEALVLDVREAGELQEGRIRGSKHIGLDALKQRINELGKYKDAPVIAYCRSGARSGQACTILLNNDFQRVFSLKGGLSAWREQNLPITKKK